VTYYAGRESMGADAEHFFESCPAVIAIESAWLDRLRACRLYCYSLPSETFECIDEWAAYFVSGRSVMPTQVQVVDDLLAVRVRRGVELRLVPELWSLRDAVVSSLLRYSRLRLTNAAPRQSATAALPLLRSVRGFLWRTQSKALEKSLGGCSS
jgi:hypothetical protein